MAEPSFAQSRDPAYVLDLQHKHPSSGAPGSEGWKERALALEVQLQELQVKYDDEHIGEQQHLGQ